MPDFFHHLRSKVRSSPVEASSMQPNRKICYQPRSYRFQDRGNVLAPPNYLCGTSNVSFSRRSHSSSELNFSAPKRVRDSHLFCFLSEPFRAPAPQSRQKWEELFATSTDLKETKSSSRPFPSTFKFKFRARHLCSNGTTITTM